MFLKHTTAGQSNLVKESVREIVLPVLYTLGLQRDLDVDSKCNAKTGLSHCRTGPIFKTS